MSLALMAAAAEYFDIDRDALIGSTRLQGVVRARAAVAIVLRVRDGLSYPVIARRFHRNDHSTAVHYLRRAKELREREPSFRRFVDAQLALPKFCPEAVHLDSPFHDRPTRSQSPIPRPARQDWEVLDCEDRPFAVDPDGWTLRDHVARQRMMTGSFRLAEALRREHPERCVA